MKPHVHKAKTDIYYAAPDCWDVYYEGDSVAVAFPAFHPDYTYRLDPSPKHPSYAVWLEWKEHPEWWSVACHQHIATQYEYPFDKAGLPIWRVDAGYYLKKSPKHPDNIKPKKKLLDWRKAMSEEPDVWDEFKKKLYVRGKNTT